MKRFTAILSGLAVLTVVTGMALADDATTQPQGATGTPAQPADPAQSTQPATPPNAGQPATPPNAGQPATAPDAAQAAAPASQPGSEALARVREHGKAIDAKVDQKVSTALDATVADVEKTAATDGDQKIAERLATEFGTTPDVLVAEKADLKTNWGQLMLAHSLLANSSDGLTARQLFDRRNEGMSWGQIAGGMGFRVGEVVGAAKTEAKVAKGLSKPDGKVAMLHVASAKSDKAVAKAEEKAKASSETKSDPAAGAGETQNK